MICATVVLGHEWFADESAQLLETLTRYLLANCNTLLRGAEAVFKKLRDMKISPILTLHEIWDPYE